MTSLLRQILRMNRLGTREFAEPFAGGAGASLGLLYLEEAAEIVINDADPAIHAFWWSVVNRTEDLIDMIARTPVSVDEWRKQRDIYRGASKKDRLTLGFATFYLNRCNRSGIVVDGGPIGGIAQAGKWKLDARFNKTELANRIRRVGEYGRRIRVTGLDGTEFVRNTDRSRTVLFIDPPYFHKGETLYLNALDATYHSELADELRERVSQPWILTYDDCPEVRALYEGWANIRPFALRYVASERRHGREILITPKAMVIPDHQDSRSITW